MPRTRAKRAAADGRLISDLLLGHAATLATGLVALWLERTFGGHYTHDFTPLFFGLFTVYAAFRGGMLGGLSCGAIGWLLLAVILSEPRALFSFNDDTRATMVIMALAFPASAALVTRLRHVMAHENAKLREAEELWRLLAEHVPDAVATIKKDGVVHYVNRDLPWTGVDRDAVVGRKLADILPADYRTTVRRMIPRVFSTGEPQHAELRLDGLDGEPTWYDLRVVPVKRDGATVASLATFADMTHRLVEEDAHQRLIALVNSSNAAIFGATADGVITSWNPGARRMYGYTADEIVGKPLATLLQPETAADAAALLSRVNAGEHIERTEMLHRKKDGTPVEVMLNASPMGARGVVSGIALIARDVGERKRVESERQRAFALLAEAERVAHVGSWEWDLATDVMTWTDELYRILGAEPGAVRPKLDAYLSRIDTEDREHVRQAIKKARKDGTPFSFDHRISRPDGETRVLRTHGAAQKDAAGKPVRVVGTVHDVTAFRKMEAKLAAQRDLLKEESQARGKALHASKLRLSRLLMTAPVILWAIDREQRLTEIEGNVLKAVGATAADILGKTVTELSDANAADACARALAGQTVTRVLQFRGRRYHTVLSPVRDKASGTIVGAVGVSIDLLEVGVRPHR